MLAQGVFFAAAALTVYSYLLYPALLWLLTWRRREPEHAAPETWPHVSLIVAAYNEEAVIAGKLENSLALDYPRGRLEILVVSDGSTDRTAALARAYADRGVHVLETGSNGGKTLAQNFAARQASGEILAFSDANSMYAEDALQQLVRPFTEADVGCVCGELRYSNPEARAAARGESLYWRYERLLKHRESLLGSALGANGAIYAVRRALFEELDADIISDFVLPLRVRRRGHRVYYEPAAVAVERAGSSMQDEYRRRIRIVARSLHGLWTERQLLNPVRYGMYSVQMLSHKVLRWLVPVFLLVLLVSSAALAGLPAYRALLVLQLVFYGLAVIGVLYQKRLGRWPVVYVPAYFCAINLGALLGLWRFLRGQRYRVWQPVDRG